MSPGRRHVLTAGYGVVGAALFIYIVRRVGVADIIDGIQRVGWGLAAILALQGLRFVLRTACWRLCMPPGRRVGFGRALGAFLAGDAVGSVTPLGLLASEPTKVFLTRHHLAPRDSIASLAVENLLYAASAVVMVVVGMGVLLATTPLSDTWRWGIIGALAAVVVMVIIGLRLLRGTWDDRGTSRPRWRERASQVRLAILAFSAGHPARLWRAFGVEMVFHVVATTEVFLTLGWLMTDRRPTIGQAIVFEALNRIVTIAFKFVPFRIGVDEALSGGAAPMLAITPAAGVALAVVRKVRNLAWNAVGLAIIAAHPARSAPEARRHESGTAPRP